MTFCTSDRYGDWRGKLLVCALAGQHVVLLTLKGNKIVAADKLFEGRARFRDIAEAPDGTLYVITDEDKPDGAIWRIRA